MSTLRAKTRFMRIAIRLWLALLAAVVLVLSVGVFVRVREEQRLLLDVTLRDRRFFAHALQRSLSRHGATADRLREARSLLASEEIADAHVDARLVTLVHGTGLPSPKLAASQIGPLEAGHIVVGVFGDELVTYVPLVASEHIALELVEEHAIDRLLTSVGWRSLGIQASALAALAALVTFMLVQALVGRPLERLVSLARQIGAGDLTARAALKQRNDEVAMLGREMNRMAERLEGARVALEEADAERVAALEQLRHADRLRTVGQLASSLAHELGTPLNVVSGHARLIEQEAATSDEGLASVRVILEQAARMTRIIKDLLSFGRRGSPRKEVVGVRAMALDAARTLSPLARRHRVHVQVDASGSELRVLADPQQILQVLTNLINNAMQAMPSGGEVRIDLATLETEPPTGVHGPHARYVRLSVSDGGVGIEPDDLPHLFEPFFTRKSEQEGTGLGLAVVEGIVREHHGWVQVESERGRGTRFDVYLPEVAADERAS